MKKTKNYQTMLAIDNYFERIKFLFIGGLVGNTLDDRDRLYSQRFYLSVIWKSVRNKVILRDRFSDLAVPGMELSSKNIIVHHIEPITAYDIFNNTPKLTDLNNLVTCSRQSHDAIHYGYMHEEYIRRSPNDHILWKEG